jgi:hypothetical protein
MYNYVVSGDQLDYQLEKNSSIHYRQPVSAVDWLKYSRLSSPNLFLSVRIIESFASVHLLLISRGEFIEEVEETERFFNIPECVELPCPVRCDQPLRDRLVPTSVFDGLFIYTRAVRSLRVNDPSGFVRSHSSRPEHAWVTSAAWDNLMHFSLTTATVRPSGIYRYHSTLWDRLQDFLHSNFFFLIPFLGWIGFVFLFFGRQIRFFLECHDVHRLVLFGFTLAGKPQKISMYRPLQSAYFLFKVAGYPSFFRNFLFFVWNLRHSGFCDDTLAADDITMLGRTVLLPKPFNGDDLARAVREAFATEAIPEMAE